MDQLVKLNAKMEVVDCSTGVELLRDDRTEHTGSKARIDPHIWTSPLNAVLMVENIFIALSAPRP